MSRTEKQCENIHIQSTYLNTFELVIIKKFAHVNYVLKNLTLKTT